MNGGKRHILSLQEKAGVMIMHGAHMDKDTRIINCVVEKRRA